MRSLSGSKFACVSRVSALAFAVCMATTWSTWACAETIVTDGDFSTWQFGSYAPGGTATVTLETTGGHPGSRLNITTVTGSLAYGTGIKTDFSSSEALTGESFTLLLDILNGAGDYGEGQYIDLLVEQNNTIYGMYLGITDYPHNWDTLSFSGIFKASSFSRLIGSGPASPDLSGAIATEFGFAGGNTYSGTLTQYYDNFRLDISPVPEPATFFLLGAGAISLIAYAWRRRKPAA